MSKAQQAQALVGELQNELVRGLDTLARRRADPVSLEEVTWQRDGGRHGGGSRFVAAMTATFNRVAVNVSHVHYADDPDKRLAWATALSTIIHRDNPHAPSLHIHISWTEMKTGVGGWRLMADLNPSIPRPADTERFLETFRRIAPSYYDDGCTQGDKYFHIPALERHRGVAHFYLEGHATDEPETDLALARTFGQEVTNVYFGIFEAALSDNHDPSDTDRDAQLAYHSAYLLQVLTLDRGTTSGLLVHDQNDVGILGSLPSHVDRALLGSWISCLPAPQDQLLGAIALALPQQHPCPVSNETRATLASVVRSHYQNNPEALALQAAGFVVPATVENHSR